LLRFNSSTKEGGTEETMVSEEKQEDQLNDEKTAEAEKFLDLLLEDAKKSPQIEFTDEFEKLLDAPAPPPTYPKTARPYSHLNFIEKEKRISSHVSCNAKIKNKENGNIHVFKKNIPDSGLSDSEVVCSYWMGLLIGKRFAPRMRLIYAYYDGKFHIVGVISKRMPWFIEFGSNKNHFFKSEAVANPVELITESIDQEVLRKSVIEKLEEFTKLLNRPIQDPKSYSYTAFNFLKSNYNYVKDKYWDQKGISSTIKEELEPYLKIDFRFNTKNIAILLDILKRRKKHLEELKNIRDITTESTCLDKTIELVEKMKILDAKEVKYKEIMYQIIQEKGIDLEKEDKNNILTETILGRPFQIKAGNLRNYGFIRGQARGNTASYLCHESDWHKYNLGDDGSRIDFDMTEGYVTYPFKADAVKKENLKEIWTNWILSRKPPQPTYTQEDIINFPVLVAGLHDYYYSPAKQTILSGGSSSASSAFTPSNMAKKIVPRCVVKQVMSRNAYSREENKLFEEMGSMQDWLFNKYLIMLKYILTTEKMYKCLTELGMRTDLLFPDSKENAFESMPKRKVANLAYFKRVLLTPPEFESLLPNFKDFLKENGECVFGLIMKEFQEYRDEFQNKIDKKKKYFYENIVKAIDIEKISQEYYQIYDKVMSPEWDYREKQNFL